MKFTLKSDSSQNILNLTRKIGYFHLPEKSSELSFVRPLDRSGYPRFHIYLKTEDKNLIFNLHLDQKRPIYKGSPAHSGEYEGGLVEKEAERVKEILSSSPSLPLGN